LETGWPEKTAGLKSRLALAAAILSTIYIYNWLSPTASILNI
jgi:hypothetical protein